MVLDETPAPSEAVRYRRSDRKRASIFVASSECDGSRTQVWCVNAMMSPSSYAEGTPSTGGATRPPPTHPWKLEAPVTIFATRI